MAESASAGKGSGRIWPAISAAESARSVKTSVRVREPSAESLMRGVGPRDYRTAPPPRSAVLKPE